MTCIVGIVHSDGVTLGADSLTTSGWTHQVKSPLQPKVFFKSNMLLGVCGELRMSNLIQHSLVVPEHKEGKSTISYLVTDFTNAVRECLKEGGNAKKTEEHEANTGGILIGYRGKVYAMSSAYDVFESANSYDAMGSGTDVALGSLHTTSFIKPRIGVLDRVTLALGAASEFSYGVRGPFVVETLTV